MRVMVIVKASKESESGAVPDKQRFLEMGKFNVQLVEAGVMLAADGLGPSSLGKRVKFANDKHTVLDGPFGETKELIAGFWLWQVKSMNEAVEWLKRAPFQDTEVEIRPVMEIEDLVPSDASDELGKQRNRIQKAFGGPLGLGKGR
jgi:hypothetical protein